MKSSQFNNSCRIQRRKIDLLGWSTETFTVGHPSVTEEYAPSHLLVFVPGNPGLVDWYLDFFSALVLRLGPSYGARGAAHAGHAVGHLSGGPSCVAWTVHGQRVLVSRPEVLCRVDLCIHLMPYFRMKAPTHKQWFGNLVACRPRATIRAHQLLARLLMWLPSRALFASLEGTMQDHEGRKIAQQLVTNPSFVENFFRLGLEEIRNVPEDFDLEAMRIIGRQCPTTVLMAGNDHWSPTFHMADLIELQQRGLAPSNIFQLQIPSLIHAFVSVDAQVPVVVDFCIQEIAKLVHGNKRATSGKARTISKL